MRSPAAVLMLVSAAEVQAQESIWIEAEHLRGVRGSCFPDMEGKTSGHWGLSGPGIAPEWTQGGESEWLSIACGPDDDQAAATYEFEVPETGDWRLWVRYRDWRRQTELFAMRIEQPGQQPVIVVFGERSVVDDEDELKLLWKWAFAWDVRPVKLAKGPAKITLFAHAKQPGHRQVDCLCLTTDTTYEPHHREKPRSATWKLLDELRANPSVSPQPLPAGAARGASAVRRSPDPARSDASIVPRAWKLDSFNNKGFVFLWNVGKPWQDELASADPKRILFPFHTDTPLVDEFRKTYGGREKLHRSLRYKRVQQQRGIF